MPKVQVQSATGTDSHRMISALRLMEMHVERSLMGGLDADCAAGTIRFP